MTASDILARLQKINEAGYATPATQEYAKPTVDHAWGAHGYAGWKEAADKSVDELLTVVEWLMLDLKIARDSGLKLLEDADDHRSIGGKFGMNHRIQVWRSYELLLWPHRWRWMIDDGSPWGETGHTFTAWGAARQAERRVRELDNRQRFDWSVTS